MPQDQTVHPAPGPADAVHGDRLGTLLRLLLWLGIVLVVAGSALELLHAGGLPHATVSLGALPAGLAGLKGAAVLTLGLLVFLVSPPLGLAYLLFSFIRARDWTFALVTLIVLTVVLGGMVLAIP